MTESSKAVAAVPTAHARGVFPLTSRPLTDLKVIVSGIPLFWLFGMEQILPPALLFWAFIKLLLNQPRLRIPFVVYPLLFFTFWQLFPQLTLAGSRDWVVSARGFISYLSILFIIMILANDVRNWDEIHGLIRAFLVLSGVATLIALLLLVGVIPATFRALLVGSLLPDLLLGSNFVQESILIREVGRPNSAFGPLTYTRISTIFLTSNSAIVSYVCFQILTLFVIKQSHKGKRWPPILLFTFALVVLLFTGSRIGWLAFFIAVGLIVYLELQRKIRLPLLLVPVTAAALVGLVAVFTPAIELIAEFINSAFVNIREGSLPSRFLLYEQTLRLWLERPIVGWGVPREVRGVNLAPVGTHGDFLGILFRSGIIGFVLYLLVMGSVGRRIWQQLRCSIRTNDQRLWYLCLAVCGIFCSLVVMQLAYNTYFDYSVVLVGWMSISLAFAVPTEDSRE